MAVSRSPPLLLRSIKGRPFSLGDMATAYSKPHLTFADQLALLKSRGLKVRDEAQALAYLERVGYHRLAPYWLPLIQSSGSYHPNAEFQNAVDLYVFDKKLRLIMLDALERIEVAVRVAVAHKIGARDAFGHRDSKYLDQARSNKHNPRVGCSEHNAWLTKADLAEGDAKEDWVSEFRSQYGGSLPVWMAVELWTFGTVVKLLEISHPNDRHAIAKKFGVLPDTFVSWMRCLNDVRNTCAHHGRLWNKPLVNQPMLPKTWEARTVQHIGSAMPSRTRIYGAAAITRYLLGIINPQSRWHERFKGIWQTFPVVPVLLPANAGCPQNWESHQLWQ